MEESLREFGDTIKWPNICFLEGEEKDEEAERIFGEIMAKASKFEER